MTKMGGGNHGRGTRFPEIMDLVYDFHPIKLVCHMEACLPNGWDKNHGRSPQLLNM